MPTSHPPPRDGYLFWGNDYPRDNILKEIDAKGRGGWKDGSGTHRRSLSENKRVWFQPLGDKLFSLRFECPVVEAHLRVAVINGFSYLGMPQSARGQSASAA
jgi:hypothetical protein